MQLILAAVLLILGIADYAKGKNAMNSLQYAKPSEMVCPDCGNTHIFINRMQTGTVNTSTCSGTAYGAGHIAFGSGTAHTYSKITSQRMAKCQDCGFDYPYITEEDIFTARNDC